MKKCCKKWRSKRVIPIMGEDVIDLENEQDICFCPECGSSLKEETRTDKPTKEDFGFKQESKECECGGTEFAHAPGIGDYCVKCGSDGPFSGKPIKPKPKLPEKLPSPTRNEIVKGFLQGDWTARDWINKIIDYLKERE